MSISKLRGKSVVAHSESAKPPKEQGVPNKSAVAAVTVTASSANSQAAAAAATTIEIPTTATTTGTPITSLPHQKQRHQQQQQQHHLLPQASLLKIEPFVASFNARLRRPISRSYSTLSTHQLKRTNNAHVGHVIGAAIIDGTLPPTKTSRQYQTTTTTTNATAAVAHLRRHPVKALARQRSKSTSSSASNRPATVNGGGNQTPNVASPANSNASSGIIVTPQPNGIFRISRLPREQEKLPDRINYDRRGLTAIPIFENEPNLRLLSLQHNLINVFHIPKETTSPVDSATQITMTTTTTTTTPTTTTTTATTTTTTTQPNQRPQIKDDQMASAANGLPWNGLNRLQRPQMRPNGIRYALNGPAVGAQAALAIGLGGANGTNNTNNSNSNARNNLLQRNLNYNTVQQQQQNRFAMKKSKSFVSNYSRYLSTVKRTMQQRQAQAEPTTTIATTPTTTTTNKTVHSSAVNSNLKSFDSTSPSVLTSESSNSLLGCGYSGDRDEDDSQLEIKNRQLHTSYGMIFQNLVFLDLYDNQIERIANLDGLPNLSVLLLGKNRISDIGGLASLKQTLRVLDLHGNKISSIGNRINCLHELKSLNLAGNQIRLINPNDFAGLGHLKELNLKRNKIKRINGFQHLVALERLWLCHNDLHKVDDMSSIAKAVSLIEVTIENNPVSLAGDCVSFLVSYLPRLQSLSQMCVTEQVRRAAMAWRKNKELSDANYTHLSTDVFNSIRREEVISNARTNWELLRSQQNVQVAFRGKRHALSPKKCELDKINESNETALSYEEVMQDFVKLPPIQQPHGQPPVEDVQPNRNAKQCGPVERDNRSGSSGSSLGPNVDSSSSCFSSDNEESSKSVELTSGTRTRLRKCTKPTKLRETAHKDKAKLPTQPDAAKRRPRGSFAQSLRVNESQATAAAAAAMPVNVENNSGQGSPNAHMEAVNGDSCKDNTDETSLATTNTSTTTTTTNDEADARLECGGVSNSHNNNNAISQTPNVLASEETARTRAGNGNAKQATAVGKRYTHGSFIKSHTVVGGNGVALTTANNKAASIQAANINKPTNNNNNNALQVPSHQQQQQQQMNGTSSAAPSGGLATATATMNSRTTTNSNALNAASSAVNIATTTSTIAANNNTALAQSSNKAAEREREQGGDYLIEISGRYLNIYGQGALRFIDKQWNATKANDVHTLNFSYINFNNIVGVLARIKVRFPHAENFVFRETNIACLGQLNALAELQGITSLHIDAEGNAITTKDLWRQYAIYRLSHWGLKQLNGDEVLPTEIDDANAIYVGLSELVLWSMPEAMLQPLLARLRLDETCTASKLSPKEWLKRDDNKSLRLVVGKEALQWKKPTPTNTNCVATTTATTMQHYQHELNANGPMLSGHALAALSARDRGRLHFAMMMENTCNAIEKLRQLEHLWPSLLLEIVRNTLLDYSQLDVYLRNLMAEVMRN